jgi:hypothetical protein
MKKVLMIAGVLTLVSAPLHAYVSSGALIGGTQPLSGTVQGATTTTDVTDVTDPTAPSDGTTLDPTIGLIDVRHPKNLHDDDEDGPTHPVPEPGTMAVFSIGLLAAAALRKKRAQS